MILTHSWIEFSSKLSPDCVSGGNQDLIVPPTFQFSFPEGPRNQVGWRSWYTTMRFPWGLDRPSGCETHLQFRHLFLQSEHRWSIHPETGKQTQATRDSQNSGQRGVCKWLLLRNAVSKILYLHYVLLIITQRTEQMDPCIIP